MKLDPICDAPLPVPKRYKYFSSLCLKPDTHANSGSLPSEEGPLKVSIVVIRHFDSSMASCLCMVVQDQVTFHSCTSPIHSSYFKNLLHPNLPKTAGKDSHSLTDGNALKHDVTLQYPQMTRLGGHCPKIIHPNHSLHNA